MSEFRKAERKKAKLRLGISAPPGAGKTMGSLLLAYGILREAYPAAPDADIWSKIVLVDTEEGSGELYVGVEKHGIRIGEYGYKRIEAPFEVQKYVHALKAAPAHGFEIIILDSISHAWSASGGILDKQGKIADASKNSYTAWRFVTPEHNAFIDAMLQSPMHLIATMRSKVEYVLETNEKGRQSPRKVGMAPVQREGMEYEFTTVFDIDFDSVASAMKDRTDLFSQVDAAGRLEKKRFMITPDTGKLFYDWLNSGVEAPKPLSLEELGALMVEQIGKCETLADFTTFTQQSKPVLERFFYENKAYHTDIVRLLDAKYNSFQSPNS